MNPERQPLVSSISVAAPETLVVPGVTLEDRACPLGCPPGDDPVITASDRLHELPGVFTVVRCRACGLLRTNPRPTQDSMGFYYPADYQPYLMTRVQKDQPRAAAGETVLRRFKRVVRRLLLHYNTDTMPPLPPGRMLEIGCASGAFLHEMAKRGWDAEGIEYSPEIAAAARQLGHKVFAGALEEAPAPDEPYDLVVGWMVLEHLHEPVLALRKLRDWSRPGAYLALSVPNAASAEFRIFGPNWYALQLPTHTYHYTPETITRVLETGGWRLERLMHQRILSNALHSIALWMRYRPFLPTLGEKLEAFLGRPSRINQVLLPLAALAAAIGQTGRMTIWARRSDDFTYEDNR